MREGWAVTGSPRGSPRAARLHHLSEGPASVEAKGTDWNPQPGFQSQPLTLGYFLTSLCLSVPVCECG